MDWHPKMLLVRQLVGGQLRWVISIGDGILVPHGDDCGQDVEDFVGEIRHLAAAAAGLNGDPK